MDASRAALIASGLVKPGFTLPVRKDSNKISQTNAINSRKRELSKNKLPKGV